MHETCLILGGLCYFAIVATNRFLGERNYKSLEKEEKLKLLDAFSQHRSLGTYIPILIMLIVIVLGYAIPNSFVIGYPIGILMVLIISLLLQVSVFRRLTELSLPADYIAKFRLQSTIVQIGNVIALSLFAYGVVGQLN